MAALKLAVQLQRMVYHSYIQGHLHRETVSKSRAMVSRSGGWKNKRCMLVTPGLTWFWCMYERGTVNAVECVHQMVLGCPQCYFHLVWCSVFCSLALHCSCVGTLMQW